MMDQDVGAGPSEDRKMRGSVRRLPCLGTVPCGRSGAASVVNGGELYIFGGYSGENRIGDFLKYSFRTKVWQSVINNSDQSPSARENNGFVSYGEKLYLFGGYDGINWLNDTWEYDTNEEVWKKLECSGNAPRERFGFVSVAYNRKLIIFGGYDGSNWLNDMHELDLDTKIWSLVNDFHGQVPSVRSCPSWAVYNGSIFIFGGYDGVNRGNELYEYRIKDKFWRCVPVEGSKPTGRYFHACGIHGNKMYIFGGYNGTTRLSCMHAFSFKTKTWSQIRLGGDVPSGRSSLVGHVYQNSFYIFGGYNGNAVLSDFYEYPFLCVNVDPPQLKNDLSRLVNHEQFYDVTFLVENRPIHGVRALMAVRSEHFRALLFGGMKESVEQQVIVLQDVQYDVFMAVLEYLYTDNVDIDPDLTVPLLIAAERYILPRLKSLCEDSIYKSITCENAIHILMQANLHNADSLKSICIGFVVDNISILKAKPQFQLLKQEPELLMEIMLSSTTGLNTD